ncbi:hypothetical protein V5N11_020820 [Cardamine amara subsp. amara]|uniref:Reverse transcriptase domain-containing protein n=1 Tax=Cardamine amara subsp. amara TaxID=228776 RepID=A0ABD1AI48_CARAN
MEFYTSSWELVGNDLIAAVKEFFTSGKMIRQVNTTAISLIPQITSAEKLEDYRPISCCNTIFKVISCILAKRLKFFIDDVVQINQIGFIHGRLLCEDVLLASELVVDFNKDGETRRGCIQIDLAKAYDNLYWRYLLNILRALELPDRFIRWINECFSTVWYSIALNGKLVGFFSSKEGFEAGRSDFFFIVCDSDGYFCKTVG